MYSLLGIYSVLKWYATDYMNIYRWQEADKQITLKARTETVHTFEVITIMNIHTNITELGTRKVHTQSTFRMYVHKKTSRYVLLCTLHMYVNTALY